MHEEQQAQTGSARRLVHILAAAFLIGCLMVGELALKHPGAIRAAEAERAQLVALAEQHRREKLADGAYFAAAQGARVYGAWYAHGLCTAATFLTLGPFGAFAAGLVCGAVTYGVTDGMSEAVHETLFQRPYHEDAAQVGRLVGTVAGALLIAPIGDYASYADQARALTEETYRANQALIDPNGLRGVAHHLHHRVPLRCGYALMIPAAIMAEASNLEIIMAEANRRIGAMGCAG